MGLAGFIIGLLYGSLTNYFDQLNDQHAGTARGILTLLHASPLIAAVLSITIFIWLSGTLRLPQKRSAVFMICIFPGTLVGLLLSAIIGTITRTIA
jgi:uncharacterized membrane protein